MLCISAGAPLKIPLRRVLEQDGTCPALKNCDLSEGRQLGLSLTDSSLAHRSLLAPTSSNRSSDQQSETDASEEGKRALNPYEYEATPTSMLLPPPAVAAPTESQEDAPPADSGSTLSPEGKKLISTVAENIDRALQVVYLAKEPIDKTEDANWKKHKDDIAQVYNEIQAAGESVKTLLQAAGLEAGSPQNLKELREELNGIYVQDPATDWLRTAELLPYAISMLETADKSLKKVTSSPPGLVEDVKTNTSSAISLAQSLEEAIQPLELDGAGRPLYEYRLSQISIDVYGAWLTCQMGIDLIDDNGSVWAKQIPKIEAVQDTIKTAGEKVKALLISVSDNSTIAEQYVYSQDEIDHLYNIANRTKTINKDIDKKMRFDKDWRRTIYAVSVASDRLRRALEPDLTDSMSEAVITKIQNAKDQVEELHNELKPLELDRHGSHIYGDDEDDDEEIEQQEEKTDAVPPESLSVVASDIYDAWTACQVGIDLIDDNGSDWAKQISKIEAVQNTIKIAGEAVNELLTVRNNSTIAEQYIYSQDEVDHIHNIVNDIDARKKSREYFINQKKFGNSDWKRTSYALSVALEDLSWALKQPVPYSMREDIIEPIQNAKDQVEELHNELKPLELDRHGHQIYG